ncbi:LysM domain-containing protein [Biscogniauxia marginata]|nr:LysM domain-containing protein [Biscogniauxia marginata]
MANRLIKGYFYSEGTLNRTCTDGCAEFLSKYEDSVASNCGDEAWENYFNADETAEEPQSVPVRIIPSLTSYLFSLACMKDEGRFCNVVIGTAAMLADPGNTLFGWAPMVSNDTEAEVPSNCDLCFIKRLRMEAGSPYYEGPRLLSMSLYESLTSSCGVSDMPLTTSTLGFSTPTGPTTGTPTPTCAGSTYSIQPGDTCYSISKSQSVGTGWLLDDNNLFAWCADFPTTGNVCITNTCSVYTVQANDTCTSIARSANITEPQLKAWNPIINLGCYNLDKMNGTTVCVSAPGRTYVPPANVTITGSPGSGTTAAPVPTDIANGTTTSCAKYHYVMPGEYCNLLSLKYAISVADLITLNPSINENCTNLYAKESYCVQAIGDINTYPGRPGFTSSQPTTTTPAGPSTAFTLLPDSTLAPYERNDTRSPLAERTREDCATYFEGAWFANVSLPASGSLASVCALAADTYFAELDALGIWNPSLGNVSAAECAFEPGKRYCGQLYWNANGAEPTPEGPLYGYEIREGYIKGCTEFNDVPLGWDCNDVFDYYDLTLAQFYEYNPEVGPDCSQLWPNYAYCTSTDPNPDDEPGQSSSTASTTQPVSTTTSAPTPTATAPGQTQSGQAENCNKWVIAQSGDSCWAIADRTGIDLEDLYDWNTVLGKDGSECGTMIWPDYWYCVGVSV